MKRQLIDHQPIRLLALHTVLDGQPGAGGYREHDILVIGEDGGVENITKFGFGPENNIIDR